MTIGIDIGYDTTKVAVRINHEIISAADQNGRTEIPSVVRETPGGIQFGIPADRPLQPGEKMHRIWDLLALPMDRYDEKTMWIVKTWMHSLLQEPLKLLKEEDRWVVVALPPAADTVQVNRIHQALSEENLVIGRFVSSGTAQMASHHQIWADDVKTVYTISCGASHLSVSSGTLGKSVLECRSEKSAAYLGSERADLALCGIITQRLSLEHQTILRHQPKLNQQMIREARRVRLDLARKEKTNFHFPSSFSVSPVSVIREDLQQILQPITQEMMKFWKALEQESGPAQAVILAGKMMKTPVLAETVQNCLKKPLIPVEIDAHQAAKGAVLIGESLQNRTESMAILESVHTTLYAESSSGIRKMLVKEGSAFPLCKKVPFHRSEVDPYSPSFRIIVWDPVKLQELCTCVTINVPASPQSPQDYIIQADMDSTRRIRFGVWSQDRKVKETPNFLIW